MAVVKNILKLTQVQGVVKVSGVNSDVATIDLSVDLKKATETVGTPEVNIQRIHWMCDRNAEFEIHRNSVLIGHGFGSGFTDYRGFSENTCFPARSASQTIGPSADRMVITTTASISGSASNSTCDA